MIGLPTPPWLTALDHIGPGHGHTAWRCREVLRGEDRDVTGALGELAEVALGADRDLLPDISTVISALEALVWGAR